MSYRLICEDCGQEHDTTTYRVHCESCGGLFDAEYSGENTTDLGRRSGVRGIAKYLATLPITDPANFVSMGEGDTPVIPLPRVAQLLGLSHVDGKLEYVNPTGSFKDRGNAVQVSVLKELGVTEVEHITGGNQGHSFAAYCARAGITYHGFPLKAGEFHPKIQAIAFHGTEMHWVDGDRAVANDEARRFAEDAGVLQMKYEENIYFVEGQKTMAYEIGDELDYLPDHIIVPVGQGSILHGLWRGFKEMVAAGRIARIPKLYGVQTEETQPIIAAYEGREWTPYLGTATSSANGIGVKNPPRIGSLVAALTESGGRPVTVSETSLRSWQKRLAELEGLFIEPTSAIVLGALENLKEQNYIKNHETVLLPFTGFGMKEPIPH